MNIVINLNPTEADYIQACIDNKEWALKKIYEDHYPTMLSVCMRYTNNQQEALDVLHDGYIKVFRNMSKYKPGTSLTAWIKRIMINTSIDNYRKRVRLRTADIDDAYYLKEKSPDVVSQLSAKEILESLQELSLTYRTVFSLFVIEGFAHKQIAKKLNISESTSRSNLVKARSKLKVILSKRHINMNQLTIQKY